MHGVSSSGRGKSTIFVEKKLAKQKLDKILTKEVGVSTAKPVLLWTLLWLGAVGSPRV